MTIEERIEKAKYYPHDRYQGEPASYRFSKSELHDLLDQVAKKQREICAREFTDEAAPMVRGHYRILNAPSPLSHE